MEPIHHAIELPERGTDVDEETAMPPALLSFFQRRQAASVQLPRMTAPN